MQTTEAFQKLKNDNTVIAQEAQLNSQAHLPLAAENERLVKENNELHLKLIEYREQVDGSDLKWKASYRQSQNEVQDLRFLLTQKENSIRSLDTENVALRTKLDKVMEKLYLPSTDQIIGGLNSDGKVHNVLRGAQAQFEVSANLVAGVPPVNSSMGHDAGASDMGEGESSLQHSSPARNQNVGIREQEWANELRRADERANEIRHKYEDLMVSHANLEAQVKRSAEQVEVRDNEILRLGGLFQGGQNLDQLHLKYQQDVNEKTVKKLQN